MNIYAYVRVSTDKQVLDNQKFVIEEFCKYNKLEIHSWIEESISGTKDYQKRLLGKALIKKIHKDDVLLCTELSRLGRTLFMIMDILNYCMNKGIKVWTIKENYRLGDDIQSKVLAFAFGISAEIERNLISQRTKEALSRLKSEGKTLGRPKGSKNKKYKINRLAVKVGKMIDKGHSKAKIAKKLKVSVNTLNNYLDGKYKSNI